MTLNEYQQGITHTYRTGRKPNHALGLAGEIAEAAELMQAYELDPLAAFHAIRAMRTVGHICDRVKKDEYHKREVDLDEMKKELGDVLWYLTALATDYGFTLDDVARTNLDKLRKRYPEGFTTGGGIR